MGFVIGFSENFFHFFSRESFRPRAPQFIIPWYDKGHKKLWNFFERAKRILIELWCLWNEILVIFCGGKVMARGKVFNLNIVVSINHKIDFNKNFLSFVTNLINYYKIVQRKRCFWGEKRIKFEIIGLTIWESKKHVRVSLSEGKPLRARLGAKRMNLIRFWHQILLGSNTPKLLKIIKVTSLSPLWFFF